MSWIAHQRKLFFLNSHLTAQTNILRLVIIIDFSYALRLAMYQSLLHVRRDTKRVIFFNSILKYAFIVIFIIGYQLLFYWRHLVRGFFYDALIIIILL